MNNKDLFGNSLLFKQLFIYFLSKVRELAYTLDGCKQNMKDNKTGN